MISGEAWPRGGNGKTVAMFYESKSNVRGLFNVAILGDNLAMFTFLFMLFDMI